MATDTICNFTLLRLVRDARSTRNSERQLLDALALRANPRKGYTSWPSYRSLAEDTGLSESSLRTAARKLEAKKLIRRKIRRDQSNIWFINVTLLTQQEAEQKAARKSLEEAKRKSDLEFPLGDVDFGDGDALETSDDEDYDNEWDQSGGAE